MGSGWYIKTFDRRRWDDIFGGGMPGAEQKILDALLWEEDGYLDDDPDGPNREQVLASRKGRRAKTLAGHLVTTGFTYRGLDRACALLLDRFGATLWSPEGLADDLDVKRYSPDFVSMTMVEELLHRMGHVQSSWSRLLQPLLGHQVTRSPARQLPLLLTGRRNGTEAQPTRTVHEFYVIFSPAEVVELSNEVRAAIDAPIPWRHPKDQPGLTEHYLLSPLTKVIESSRWAAMSCNL